MFQKHFFFFGTVFLLFFGVLAPNVLAITPTKRDYTKTTYTVVLGEQVLFWSEVNNTYTCKEYKGVFGNDATPFSGSKTISMQWESRSGSCNGTKNAEYLRTVTAPAGKTIRLVFSSGSYQSVYYDAGKYWIPYVIPATVEAVCTVPAGYNTTAGTYVYAGTPLSTSKNITGGTQAYTLSCDGATGVLTQTAGTASCSGSSHLENNACVSNTKTCSVTNGSGTQTWNGSSWNTCVISSCNTGYQTTGTECVQVEKTGKTRSNGAWCTEYFCNGVWTCGNGQYSSSGSNSPLCSSSWTSWRFAGNGQSGGCSNGYAMTNQERNNDLIGYDCVANCPAGTIDGFSYSALNHGTTATATRDDAGARKTTRSVGCTNGTVSSTSTTFTYSCDSGYTLSGDDCYGNALSKQVSNYNDEDTCGTPDTNNGMYTCGAEENTNGNSCDDVLGSSGNRLFGYTLTYRPIYCYPSETVIPRCGIDLWKSGASCVAVGTGYFSPQNDDARMSCTNTKPLNSAYSGSGGGENNCPWVCNAGFQKNSDGNACVQNTIDLAISNNNSDISAIAGGTFWLNIRTENLGNTTALNPSITIPYDPTKVEVINFGSCANNASTHRITCTEASFSAGNTGWNPAIQFRAKTSGTISFSPTIASDINGNPNNNAFIVSVAVSSAPITFVDGTTNFSFSEDKTTGYNFTKTLTGATKYKICDTTTPSIAGTKTTNENFSLYYGSAIILTARNFDFENISDKTFALCIAGLDNYGNEIGRGNFTINVSDVNERPIILQDVSWTIPQSGTTISKTLKDGTEFNLQKENDFGKFEFRMSSGTGDVSRFSNPSGTTDIQYTYTGTETFGQTLSIEYRVCDNKTPALCSSDWKKLNIAIQDGRKCSHDGQEKNHGENHTFYHKNDYLGLFGKNVTCNNGNFSETLSTDWKKAKPTSVNLIFSVGEKSSLVFGETTNTERKALVLGKLFSLSPQWTSINYIPEEKNISAEISVSFSSEFFETKNSATENWNCSSANETLGEVTTCTKSIYFSESSKIIDTPFAFVPSKTGEASFLYTIKYTPTGGSVISDTETIYVKTSKNLLEKNVVEVVENIAEKNALPALGVINEQNVNFSVAEDSLCDTSAKSAVGILTTTPSAKSFLSFGTDKKTLKIDTVLTNPISWICVKATSSTGNFLGYFPITVNVTAEDDFFVEFSEDEFAENEEGITIGSITSLSDASITDITTPANSVFETLKKTQILTDTQRARNQEIIQILTTALSQNNKTDIEKLLKTSDVAKFKSFQATTLKKLDQKDVAQWKIWAEKQKSSLSATIKNGEWILKLKNGKSLDFESNSTKLSSVALTATINGQKTSSEILIAVKDINEAPTATQKTDTVALPLGESRILDFSALGIATDPDIDFTDDASSVKLEGIFVGNTPPSLDAAEWKESIVEANQYSFVLLESSENKKIEVKNLGATGNKTLYFKLCDNNSLTGDFATDVPFGKKQCVVSSITGTFAEASKCSATTIGDLLIPETLHGKSAGSFYAEENSASCSRKELNCVNGKLYWADDKTLSAEVKNNVFFSCKKQCTGPIKTGGKNLYNTLETAKFFSTASAQNCPAEGDLELKCHDGQWMNGSTTVVSPFLECKKSCAYKGDFIDHNAKATFYTASSFTGIEKCSMHTVELLCSNGSFTGKQENHSEICADDDTVNQCEIAIDQSPSLFLDENKPLSQKLFVEENAIKCVPAKVECKSGKKLLVNGVESTQKLYLSCGKQCLYPSDKDETTGELTYKPNGSTSNLAVSVGGRCTLENLTCEDGKWKTEKDRWIQSPSLACATNVGVGTGDERNREDIVTLIEDKKDTTEIFKIFNHPLNNIKNAEVKMLDLRKEPISIYDAKAGTNDQNFMCPFQESGSTAAMNVKIRFYKKNTNDDILEGYDVYDTEDAERVVLRWKVSAKDKNGDPITLIPSYNYTEEGDSCPDSMVCLKHIEAASGDATGNYKELTLSQFSGKIFSKSQDEDIQDVIAELSENGEVSYLDFLGNSELGIAFPSFEILPEIRLENAHMVYKFEVTGLTGGQYALSDGKFRIESVGTYNGTQQKISTIVEQGKLLPVFNYVIFGE